ncbi:MAG: hypothetical protein QME50_04015 [Candidatus Bathyarchaeota archaeon]|nr:hypothetical protein [Candidatus Bathyarchaeota archaeon]
MPKGVAKERKLIAVPSELVRALNEIANRKGTPFYEYTVEALEQAVRASLMRRTIREIVDFYEIMEMERASGTVLVPRDALNWFIKKLYPEERDAMQKVWLDAGRWFGKYLTAKLHSKEEAIDILTKILETSRWELDEVSLEKKENAVRVRLMSFVLSEENTELLMSYVEGVMESLGYETGNKECMRGMVIIDFRKGNCCLDLQ